MKDEEFFEFVKHDLKGIQSDLKGFLEVYYPMLRSSWNPQNESDFIIGWLLGSKEQDHKTHTTQTPRTTHTAHPHT